MMASWTGSIPKREEQVTSSAVQLTGTQDPN